jgi:hypothetical protein
LVTRLSVPFIHLASRQPAFVARADATSVGTPRLHAAPRLPGMDTPAHALATTPTAARADGRDAGYGLASFD